MEETRLDNELKKIHHKFSFLWKNYGFHSRYFTRDYGMYYKGYVVGIENSVCKLVFEKETNSMHQPIAISVGKISSSFTPPNYYYNAKCRVKSANSASIAFCRERSAAGWRQADFGRCRARIHGICIKFELKILEGLHIRVQNAVQTRW